MREKPFDSLALIVDVETIAIPDAGDYLEPVVAPSNYKDEAKIASYVVEKRAERLNSAALDCDLCQIVAVGMQLEGRDSEPRVLLCRDAASERYALDAFWTEMAIPGNRTRPIVGFNVLGFDLPVIARRSQYLGLWPNRNLVIDRYRSASVVDIYQRLSFNNLIKAHSLRFYGKRFGLEIEAPELSGADVAAYVEAGDWKAVERHCASDVALTYTLASRLRLIEFNEDEFDEAERQRRVERRSA